MSWTFFWKGQTFYLNVTTIFLNETIHFFVFMRTHFLHSTNTYKASHEHVSTCINIFHTWHETFFLNSYPSPCWIIRILHSGRVSFFQGRDILNKKKNKYHIYKRFEKQITHKNAKSQFSHIPKDEHSLAKQVMTYLHITRRPFLNFRSQHNMSKSQLSQYRDVV